MSKRTPFSEAFEKIQAAFDDLHDALTELGTTNGGDEGEEPESKPKRGKAKAARKKKDKGPTIEDVRASLLKVIEEHGNDGATEVLEDFEVNKVSELESEQFADVIEACEKYLEG